MKLFRGRAMTATSPETASSSTSLRIDFVSDVVCPWCAIGLKSLQRALRELDGEVVAELHFQPFELNPRMPPDGENALEHLVHKYQTRPEQVEASGQAIAARGAELGFTFGATRDRRIYNTFDAHRLLHWAELEGRQLALKEILLRAYFSNGENVASHDTLVRLAGEAGLDTGRAREILAAGTYADEVRAQEQWYTGRGIHSVPAIIINDRHLISGGQPPEVFAQALRKIAAGN
jgi:predicted DsbA family dithiol-disulfide isomerase